MANLLLVVGPRTHELQRVGQGLERLGLGEVPAEEVAFSPREHLRSFPHLNRVLLRLFDSTPESAEPIDFTTLPSALAEWFIDRAQQVLQGHAPRRRIVISTELGQALPFWREGLRPDGCIVVLDNAPESASRAVGDDLFILDPALEETELLRRVDLLTDRLAGAPGETENRPGASTGSGEFVRLLRSAGGSSGSASPVDASIRDRYEALIQQPTLPTLLDQETGEGAASGSPFDWNEALGLIGQLGDESAEFVRALAVAFEEREAQVDFLNAEARRLARLLGARSRSLSSLKERREEMDAQLQLERDWRSELQRDPALRLGLRLLGKGRLLEDPRIIAAVDPDDPSHPVVSRRSKSRDKAKLESGLETLRRSVFSEPWPWPNSEEDLALAPSPREVEMWLEMRRRLTGEPTFSVLVPVHRIKADVLRHTLQSVFDQVYERWELCLAVDSAVDGAARQVIESFRERFPDRLRIEEIDGTPGIAVSTNRASDLATGDFIAFLDHDDRLTPDALLLMAQYLEAHPDADLIYTDEDCIGDDAASGPIMRKPGYSPELLLCCNYMVHLVALRRSLFQRIGRIREGFELSQDYDLVLRASEEARHVGHIPQVLYHWRIHGGASTHGPGRGNRKYREASRRALQEAADQRGWKAEAQWGLEPDTYRLRFEVDQSARVTVIIPTHNNVSALRRCVRSLQQRTRHRNFEILIVSNNASPRMVQYLDTGQEEGRFRVLRRDIPFNFSALNNFAVRHTETPYVLLLNDDTEALEPGWMEAMLEHAQREEIGAVGAKLLFPGNIIQHAGVFLDRRLRPAHAFKDLPHDFQAQFALNNAVRNCVAVTAACLMVRRSVYLEIGGFNEELAVTFNDVDFCLKLVEAGYRNVYTPYARLLHYESASRGLDQAPEKSERLFGELEQLHARWKDLLERDPYFVPQLDTSRGVDFGATGF